MKIKPASQIIEQAKRTPELWIEPDAFLRYFPIIQWIQKQRSALKLLEIGSGDFGLSTYLACPLVKVDLKFHHLSKSNGQKVAADAVQLPFKAGSFDLVFSVDCFEHLPQESRLPVLNEMVRVSKCEVITVFPCGSRARNQDLEIGKIYNSRKGKPLEVFQAHELNMFPEENDIIGWAEALSSKIKRWKIQSSFNLTLRKKFICGWLDQSPAWFMAIRWLLKFPKIFSWLHFGVCYRRILSLRARTPERGQAGFTPWKQCDKISIQS